MSSLLAPLDEEWSLSSEYVVVANTELKSERYDAIAPSAGGDQVSDLTCMLACASLQIDIEPVRM